VQHWKYEGADRAHNRALESKACKRQTIGLVGHLSLARELNRFVQVVETSGSNVGADVTRNIPLFTPAFYFAFAAMTAYRQSPLLRPISTFLNPANDHIPIAIVTDEKSPRLELSISREMSRLRASY
jgi:hypothetical protein